MKLVILYKGQIVAIMNEYMYSGQTAHVLTSSDYEAMPIPHLLSSEDGRAKWNHWQASIVSDSI
jgi:hypothetical protein